MQACGAHMRVCICGATLRFVFFLCRWFCPFVCVSGSVSVPMQGWFGDAQGRWKVVKSAPVCCGFYFALFHVVVFLFQFLFHLSISLRHLALVTFFSFVYIILFHLSQFLSIYLASVFPCHSFTTSISSAGTPE